MFSSHFILLPITPPVLVFRLRRQDRQLRSIRKQRIMRRTHCLCVHKNASRRIMQQGYIPSLVYIQDQLCAEWPIIQDGRLVGWQYINGNRIVVYTSTAQLSKMTVRLNQPMEQRWEGKLKRNKLLDNVFFPISLAIAAFLGISLCHFIRGDFSQGAGMLPIFWLLGILWIGITWWLEILEMIKRKRSGYRFWWWGW